jgi:hypothetical protein
VLWPNFNHTHNSSISTVSLTKRSFGWWLVMICAERKVLLAGCWWLVYFERKVLLVGG